MTKKQIDVFKNAMEKESTMALLHKYGFLFYCYIEFTDDEDVTKMEIILNEILKRAGGK